MGNRKQNQTVNDVLAAEHGGFYVRRSPWVALGYPAPYSVGASSLGFQTVYRSWNESGNISCERFFYSLHANETAIGVPTTVEHNTPITQADAVAFSLACETDLLPTIELLQRAGIAPLAKDRADSDPPIIIGGPLTLLDPRLVAPLADLVVCGEAEDALDLIAQSLGECICTESFLEQLRNAQNGIWIPRFDAAPPLTHYVGAEKLPAFAATWSPLAGLKDLFLVEIARGCPRRCAFCLLAKTGKFRGVSCDDVLSKIPDEAKGVGLVGAAVTDHPNLEEIVARIVATDRRVSLSSMRADRLTPNLLRELVKGGLRSLTVAADGSSEQIRIDIKKGITEQHLLNAAQMARTEKLRGLKLYSMVGLPGETAADIDEFARLVIELSTMIRITVAIQGFVPKPNTPLCDVPMLGQKEIKNRLNRFKRAMKGRVNIQSSSPRWSWVDWKLAHGKESSALVAMEVAQMNSISATNDGGQFSVWKSAIQTLL